MKVQEKIYAKNYKFSSIATNNNKNIILGLFIIYK